MNLLTICCDVSFENHRASPAYRLFNSCINFFLFANYQKYIFILDASFYIEYRSGGLVNTSVCRECEDNKTVNV